MKTTKRMLISIFLVFTLCMLTACKNNKNAADEVPNTTNNSVNDADNNVKDKAQ